MSKLMMLVAAKWRDFTNINPNTEQEPESVAEESYARKTGRSRTSKDASKVFVLIFISRESYQSSGRKCSLRSHFRSKPSEDILKK
jgi:hypothetical protein